ncbi:PIG-L deacetylase family protein [Maridesulfovibrio sp.]|uniref:PIG-L deacetylase family protein n=1 Tax=Maridesulfovibrio sp. TaxID=2795000 RepID=UPI002A18B409|nr:PIG-L deacetylase family protein [Maridesulfovibrio sp.]
MNKILAVAVHPDDETLGCGGSLLAHKEAGDEIHWLILTGMREELGYSRPQMDARALEIKSVAEAYGFDTVHNLDLPTSCLDELPLGKIISGICSVISEVEPNIVYLPFYNDVHSDHRIAFEAAMSCTKNFRYPFIKKILCMEVPSETEYAAPIGLGGFIPNVFADVTRHMDRKCEIMKIFNSETGEPPFPRSEGNIRAQARFRGGACNCIYAESFMLVKEIIG